jgi:uncharacterized DUF497 family protein
MLKPYERGNMPRPAEEYTKHTLCAIMHSMKHYTWNPEKNKILKKERGVGFEDVVFHIEAGDEVDVLEHPNKERYPNQKISVVLIEGYAYLVPFVESEVEFFLKTIIPSRKATKLYVGDHNEKT